MALELQIVRVKPHRQQLKFYRYNVFLDGELILERSRDPEFDACRALLAKNPDLENETVLFFVEGKPSLSMRIGYGATRRTIESETRGPCIGEWKPYDQAHEDDEAA